MNCAADLTNHSICIPHTSSARSAALVAGVGVLYRMTTRDGI